MEPIPTGTVWPSHSLTYNCGLHWHLVSGDYVNQSHEQPPLTAGHLFHVRATLRPATMPTHSTLTHHPFFPPPPSSSHPIPLLLPILLHHGTLPLFLPPFHMKSHLLSYLASFHSHIRTSQMPLPSSHAVTLRKARGCLGKVLGCLFWGRWKCLAKSSTYSKFLIMSP